MTVPAPRGVDGQSGSVGFTRRMGANHDGRASALEAALVRENAVRARLLC